MKLKAKVLKRIISVLCAISMSTSFVITSAGAINTNNAEAAFSMQYMNSLPKPGEDNFDKFSGKYERDEIENNKYTDTLQDKKVYHVKYPKDDDKDFRIDKEEINEKQVYEDIKKTVTALKQKVKDRTPYDGINDEALQIGIKHKNISKHYKMPEEMRLAKAIYRWVVKKIPYDYDSLKEIKGKSLRKPQDALYVFAKKTGVCVGKANLANLMMRIAGIPSAFIGSRTHAFNAIYLKDTVNHREGWTLIDSTWGAPSSDQEMQAGKKAKVETLKDILEMSGRRFVRIGFEEVNKEYVERINTINRLHNHASLKDSKEYTEKFYTLCENLFEQYKDVYTNNINILKNGKDKQAEDRIKAIVDGMNQKIKAEIDKLNQQYNNIAKFESFKIIFVDRNVNKPLEDTLAVKMKVDFPEQDALQIAEKFAYWSDNRKVFFPGFYDKAHSFEYANENIIDKRAHKFRQIIFGNWFDGPVLNSVFDLNINGVKYEVLGIREGKSYGFELTGDINNPLENVVISPDLVGFGVSFRIGSGIKSLTLKGDESIDWSNSERLKSVDVTESKKYMVENGELYKTREDGLKIGKVIVPHGIKFIDNRSVALNNEQKFKYEYAKVLNELHTKNNEFRSWRDSDKNKGKVLEDPKVKMKRAEVIALCQELYNKFDVKKAEQFIKLAKEAIDMMDKFKTDYENQRVEPEILEKAKDKLIENINEYDNWLKSKNKQDDDIVNQKRNEIIERYNNIINNPTNKNVADFEQSVEEIIDSIDSSKRVYFWDESNKKHKDLVNKYREFYKWVNSENVSRAKYNDVWNKNIKAVDFFKSNCNINIIDENDMEKFLTLSKEAIDIMDNFKKEYEKEKVKNNFAQKIQAIWKGHIFRGKIEQEKLDKETVKRVEKEFHEVFKEFFRMVQKFKRWRKENLSDIKEDRTHLKRNEVLYIYRTFKSAVSHAKENGETIPIEEIQKIIDSAKTSTKEMKEFMNERLERERKEKEEQERLERERKEKEEQERLERERKEKEEQERLERERKEKEKQERLERERKEKEEQERLERERKEKEEQERLERERKAKEFMNKKRLDAFYNKGKEIVGKFNEIMSDFKQWLFEEHNINLDDDSNLREADERINEAKKIIDETAKSVINAEAEVGNGYTDEKVALKVNTSLAKRLIELRKKIQEFKDKNSK